MFLILYLKINIRIKNGSEFDFMYKKKGKTQFNKIT